MLVAHEIDRDAPTHRTAHGDADAPTGRALRDEPEGGRKDRPGAVLRPAEEAPRPLPRRDPLRGELGQLAAERVGAGGHQVEERPLLLEPERREVELVLSDEARVLVAAAAG